MTETDRQCTKCKKTQPIKSFSKLINGRSGRRAQCKGCDKAYNSNKGLRVPLESSEYVLNKLTMFNHMYIHFGWWESTKTQVERDQKNREVKKYYIEEQNTKFK